MAVASEIPIAAPPFGKCILANEASEALGGDIRHLCCDRLFATCVENLERRF